MNTFSFVSIIALSIVGLISESNATIKVAQTDSSSTLRNTQYTHPYTRVADSLFNQNQFDLAFYHYEKALKLFMKENEREGIAKCLNKVALRYQLANKYDTAIFILKDN